MAENAPTPNGSKARKTAPRTATTGRVAAPAGPGIKHRNPAPPNPAKLPEAPPSDTPDYDAVKHDLGWEPGDDDEVWKEAETVTKELADFKEAVDRDGFEARP